MSRLIHRTVEELDDNDIPENLETLLALLTDLFYEIPKEFRKSAFIEFYAQEDCGSLSVSSEVYYYSPETPEEIKEKEFHAKKREEKKEADDLELFAHLKAKYGN